MKMALITYQILPGTWLGVGQVGHLICKLNRLTKIQTKNVTKAYKEKTIIKRSS